LVPPKRLITISVPVLNEADNIKPLIGRLRAVADAHRKYDFEFLFTDNASTDATFERLAEEAQLDNRVRVIRFTRNFGFQTSILTNYLNARGCSAIQIDADLATFERLAEEAQLDNRLSGFFAALFYFAWYFLVVRNPPQGFTTLVILLLLSTSIQTAFIGLLGEYIGRIFRNTRHIPAPIIDQRIEPVRTHDAREAAAPDL